MSIHVTDCPRCKAQKTTFDVLAFAPVREIDSYQDTFYLEVPMQCRNCKQVSVISANVTGRATFRDLNDLNEHKHLLYEFLDVLVFVTLADVKASAPPEHLPQNIHNAFVEGAKCYAAGCYNAAGAMFRLSLDLASKSQLPKDDTLTNHRQKTNLADRLEWLFENNHWPVALKEMVTCIRQDGNDGAHDGELGEAEAFDIMDFSFMVLEKIYAEPERIRISQERRAIRKQ
ncbi:DUF4145 domain-containing protein [Shewanella sp. S-1]|uniref:DUF4145 domain-containing protein n=1 Tax=Shewanella oncorhynchi TaxID=2726434 RepID=A0ABX1KP31_9GAMM|nr:DUF4145 domain-containing protein [Shewanella oncorhynchi]NLQ23399.1 DUF4145 domain-containing protein [Shewanella oncorhynchi]